MTLDSSINKIKKLKAEYVEVEGLKINYRSKVLSPSEWHKEKLQKRLDVRLPDDLVKFWNLTSGIRLYEDITYGQWGLVLFGPEKVEEQKQRAKEMFPDHVLDSDLIIGEYLGEAQLAIVRCNASEEDFGHVLVALPMSARSNWIYVAKSLEEFLRKSLEFPTQFYWDLNK